MAHRISSTPCDSSGCEATEESAAAGRREGRAEERATASPADDGAAETTASPALLAGVLGRRVAVHGESDEDTV
ncbi:hypothetical protein ZWY2020_030273 [Hordeum vulgare]|nr:hypothetical protein ZWY2020_030273 [Hordeum vulgare]